MNQLILSGLGSSGTPASREQLLMWRMHQPHWRYSLVAKLADRPGRIGLSHAISRLETPNLKGWSSSLFFFKLNVLPCLGRKSWANSAESSWFITEVEQHLVFFPNLRNNAWALWPHPRFGVNKLHKLGLKVGIWVGSWSENGTKGSVSKAKSTGSHKLSNKQSHMAASSSKWLFLRKTKWCTFDRSLQPHRANKSASF